MEPDQNRVKVQDILRKFEANETPQRPAGKELTCKSSNFIAVASKRNNVIGRRSAPAVSINRSYCYVPHLNPVLELRRPSLPSANSQEVMDRSAIDAKKRSVIEIARLFQPVAGNLKATYDDDVTARVHCLIKEVDPIKSEEAAKVVKKSLIPAPLKPVRTFAHDVYMCSKQVLEDVTTMTTTTTTTTDRNKLAARADSDKTSSCTKPRLPPKPIVRSKTVPNMPRRPSPRGPSSGAKVVRPSGPPPKPPITKPLSRTKSAADKIIVGVPVLKRSFSDEHIYDLPGVLRKSDHQDTASDDEFVVVDNDVYGSSYAPYVVPYRETTAVDLHSNPTTNEPKELHYMSTPIVAFPSGHEEARRCRSRSVSGRKLQRGSGLANRTLGRSRRVVTDEDLVNWSFSSVYATTPRRHNHASNSGKDNDSGDSDPEISEKQVRDRIAYIHRISRGPSLKGECEMNNGSYRRQYDAVLTVGLQFSNDGLSLEPFVKDVFPRADCLKVNMDTVARFCFPDAESWRPSSAGETHTFVLTNELGGRLFGYCRKVKPEGANSSLPVVYCVLSPILARAYYSQVLVEIEKRHGLSDVQMKGFLQALHNRSVPHPGRTIHLRCSNTDVDVRVALSRYNDFGLDNSDTCRLLTRLSISSLLKVYSCLLLERRVLLCSSSLNSLTESVMALVALLYPFSWPHTLVPVLPTAMLDVAASPTPYVIGVMNSARPQLDEVPIEEGIVVDLDESRVISEAGDEETILPKKIQKGITASLKFVKHRSEVAGSPSSSLISEAFLTMFAKLVGHYHDHFELLPDGQKIFKRDDFCAAPTSRSERLFLEWFTETQMFQIFIENKIAENHSVEQDVFKKHLERQRAEPDYFKPTIRTNVFGFGKKVINFGEKLIGMK